MNLADRAAAHAALGDRRRLGIVDQLALGDRTFAELAESAGIDGNLLAHHLEVLEDAGLISRRVSEADRRRRYITLTWDRLPPRALPGTPPVDALAFICTRNSARSQFAAAFWENTTGKEASSAGSRPAAAVHPGAIRAAGEFGIDLSGAKPGGYDRLSRPDLVVTVCDRAREGGVPEAGAHLHWSIPDPVSNGSLAAFRTAFAEIADRVERLSRQVGMASD